MPMLSTVAAFGFEGFDPPGILRMYQRLGCRSSQFVCNPQLPTPDSTEARKIAQDAGVPFDSLHGVFGPEHDPSSPDSAVRNKAIETYRAEAQHALDLGGPMVVIHPAPIADDSQSITEHSRAQRIAPLRRSMEQLAQIGQQTGVIYLIENIPPNYHFGSDPIQLAQMIRQLDHPHVRMCFDTGHAHMAGCEVSAALQDCLDVVAYLHIHDNDAVEDSHAIPGRGTINWDQLSKVMAKLPGNLYAMLELFQSIATLEQLIAQGLPDRLVKWLALNNKSV